MRVPQFDMAAELAPVRAAVEAAALRVIASGRFIGGPEVDGFEQELAAFVGARRAIGVSSGTDALVVTLMALGIGAGPGDEVVTTPFTFFATAGAIARLGARPVFADVDEETLCLDARRVAGGGRVRAVIPVNLFGRPAPIPQVGVPVVEDAAQSIGSGPVRGIAATLSFFPTKNLGAIGDAGAVVTDDDALADRIALLRSHGARTRYRHELVGGNFRLDALQAAVLRAKLPHVGAWTAARRAAAARYRALFAAAPSIPPELRLPPEDAAHVYHHFVIRAPRRDALRAHLTAAGVGSEVYYPVPLHQQPCFAALGPVPSLPVAERAAGEVLALPMYPSLGAEAQAIVVDEVARFYAG